MRRKPTRGPPLDIERALQGLIVVPDEIYKEAVAYAELHSHNYLVLCSWCSHGLLALLCQIRYLIDGVEGLSCENLLVSVSESLGNQYRLEDYIVRAVKVGGTIIIVANTRLLREKDVTTMIKSLGCTTPLKVECYYSAYDTDEVIDQLLHQYTVLRPSGAPRRASLG